MASDTPPDDNTGQAGQAAERDQQPQIAVLAQYVKDLSFENPQAPDSVAEGTGKPQGNVSIQVKTRRLSEDKYEILLEFNIEAKNDDAVVFIVELTYGGVFGLRGFDEAAMALALWVECPRLLFPFARRIIADAVRDGGFPPLMLGPIDFLSLSRQRGAPEPVEG